MTNTNTQMRKGFTMIELIFVIVIIGILAAVAIPKLATNKDDAVANTCVHEVGQFKSEFSQSYAAAPDFATWKKYIVDENVTNINLNVKTGNGIENALGTLAHNVDITYMCDGDSKPIVTMKGSIDANGNYTFKSTVGSGQTSPAAVKAVKTLTRQQNGLTVKTYRL